MYYGEPEVGSLSPTTGPLLGGTRVRISGKDFSLGVDYVCSFGGSRVPAVVARGMFSGCRRFAPSTPVLDGP